MALARKLVRTLRIQRNSHSAQRLFDRALCSKLRSDARAKKLKVFFAIIRCTAIRKTMSAICKNEKYVDILSAFEIKIEYTVIVLCNILKDTSFLIDY